MIERLSDPVRTRRWVSAYRAPHERAAGGAAAPRSSSAKQLQTALTARLARREIPLAAFDENERAAGGRSRRVVPPNGTP